MSRGRWVTGVALVIAAQAMGSALAGHGAGGLVPSYRGEHVRRMMEAGETVVVIDLRPAAAFRKAHVPGARSIPLDELPRRLGEVPRSGRVVLYGDSIVEASQGHALLQDRGHRNAAVLEEGFAGWVRQGFPVEASR